jgi:hypothetical protein
MNRRRQEVLTFLVLVLLLISLGFQVRELIVERQPFTQYCDWVQPGKVLTCHR